MPSPFTTTLEKFADNEKRIFDNKKNIYFLQACTESELEYLAEKKRHNTVAIDLSIFSKVTLEQAEYVSKMRALCLKRSCLKCWKTINLNQKEK
jgi:hypothetical protein